MRRNRARTASSGVGHPHRRRLGRFLALVLGTLLLLPTTAALLESPGRARVPLPGSPPPQQPAGDVTSPRESWWEPGRAYSCGRNWCSHVVLTYRPLPPPPKRIVVAVAPTADSPGADARAAVELRSEAIVDSIVSLVSRLRQQKGPEGTAPAPAPSPAAWFFWNQKPPHPRTPALEVGIENNQTVIYVVGDPARAIAQQTVATVTETDASQAGVGIPELAGRWRDSFRRTISDALWGIDFDRRYPLARELLVVAFVLAGGFLLLLLSRVGRALEGIQRRVRHRQQLLERSSQEGAMAAVSGGVATLDLQRLTSLHNPAALRQAGNLLRLLRRLLLFSNVAAVFAVAALSLAVFPATRNVAIYLTGQSLLLPLLWVGLIVLQPLLALAVDHVLARWGRSMAQQERESNRSEQRINTYSKVLRLAVTFFCLLIGLYGTVLLLGLDPTVLAGAGLVAVAIGFLTRNLLEDMINGVLILCTDRFAIGDVINVGDKGGLVEDMNLHVTSLRGSDGQLTTIPNRRIDVVDNLTQQWSRVDFTVRVGSAVDPQRALAVIEAEAQRLWQEPQWHELLTEPPSVLGIDEISHAGTLIRVWIATRPLKQWLVGREFRLRIKLALAEAEIELGIPQQRVHLPPPQDAPLPPPS